MDLLTRWNELDRHFGAFSGHFQAFISSKPLLTHPLPVTEPEEYFLEGLLSRVWQAWCEFCRGCVVDSCLGTVTASGTTIVALPGAASESHVSRAAIQAKKGQSITWAPPNGLLRVEPTWGDPDVLNTILSKLGPLNSSQMLAAVSSAYDSAKALQLIRNAAAHQNAQSMAELTTVQAKYSVFPTPHATHALFWVAPATGAFLLSHAIDDLLRQGQAAVT